MVQHILFYFFIGFLPAELTLLNIQSGSLVLGSQHLRGVQSAIQGFLPNEMLFLQFRIAVGLVKSIAVEIVESPVSSHGLTAERGNIFSKLIRLDNGIHTLRMR